MSISRTGLLLSAIEVASLAVLGLSSPARAACSPASTDPACPLSPFNPTGPNNIMSPNSPYNPTRPQPFGLYGQDRPGLECLLGIGCPRPEPAAAAEPAGTAPVAPPRHRRHRRPRAE